MNGIEPVLNRQSTSISSWNCGKRLALLRDKVQLQFWKKPILYLPLTMVAASFWGMSTGICMGFTARLLIGGAQKSFLRAIQSGDVVRVERLWREKELICKEGDIDQLIAYFEGAKGEVGQFFLREIVCSKMAKEWCSKRLVDALVRENKNELEILLDSCAHWEELDESFCKKALQLAFKRLDENPNWLERTFLQAAYSGDESTVRVLFSNHPLFQEELFPKWFCAVFTDSSREIVEAIFKCLKAQKRRFDLPFIEKRYRECKEKNPEVATFLKGRIQKYQRVKSSPK